MKKITLNLLFPILSALILAACSSPEGDDASKNSNASPQSAELTRPAETVPASNDSPQTPQVSAPPAAIPVAPAQPLVSEAQPRLVVPLKKIDFGRQPKDKSLNRSIVIKNTGKADLHIESVQPSCGCTTVDFPKVIVPGRSGSIKVKVDTGQSAGQHSKSVTIKSNDPAQPTVQVELVYTVK